jgi:hypothetical protein
MARLRRDRIMRNDEIREEIQVAFQENSERRITAAIRTLRQTVQEEHERHVDDLLRDALSDSTVVSQNICQPDRAVEIHPTALTEGQGSKGPV